MKNSHGNHNHNRNRNRNRNRILEVVIMINLLKKGMQILNGEHAQYEQLRVSDEYEYQVMCCGTFNPRLLAEIKRSKADNKR